MNFVGFDNYVDVFSDPKFRKAAVNTAIFVFVGVPLTMSLGLLAAVALNQGDREVPPASSGSASTCRSSRASWRSPSCGGSCSAPTPASSTALLDQVGIDGPAWLTDTRYALPSMIVMAAWKNLGFSMIVFLAGLQSIPVDLYEAAAVDGAKRWQPFRYITLPLLRPTMLFVAVITTIGYVQFFEEPLVMTQGGPLDSTLSVSYSRVQPVQLRQLRLHRGRQLRPVRRDRVCLVHPVPAAPAEDVRRRR